MSTNLIAILSILTLIGVVGIFIYFIKRKDSKIQKNLIATQDPIPLPSPPISPSVTKKFGPENPLI